MKIGVAIPYYYSDIQKLYDLLDSIEKQTMLPDKVVVSTSSTSNFIFNKIYYFTLEFVVNEDEENVAKNRNLAASKLEDMDYITFIEPCDIMHPQRIEILLKCFDDYESDIILHNYFEPTDGTIEGFFENIEEINIRNQKLEQYISGCITHSYPNNGSIVDKIHHGNVTIKQKIFEIVKFPEQDKFIGKENCIFCFIALSLPNIKNAYIQNKITYCR
jgi:hypothetical protein